MSNTDDLSWFEAITMCLSGLGTVVGTFGLLLRVYGREKGESYQSAVHRSRVFILLIIVSFLVIAMMWAISFFI